ncbi:MAG: hypothetical protein H0V77_07380 [Actinobacteria bacterium]|nr:hypothetical protein [Actinomycetota bacterium]
MSHERVDGEVRLSLSRPAAEVLSEFGVDCPDNVKLLQIGQPPGAGTG